MAGDVRDAFEAIWAVVPMIFCWKIAKQKDRDPIIWLLLSLLFGWLALLVLVCIVDLGERK